MNRKTFITINFFLAGIFSSCTKTPVYQNPGDAQWIKVVVDSPVFFTGKIRADAQNNLYCSYNYLDDQISGTSAIIKFDPGGKLLWRKEFSDLSIYDFIVDESGNITIASSKDSLVTLIEISSTCDTCSIGSYGLPGVGYPISGVAGMKILITTDGNYILSGTMSLDAKKVTGAGFVMEMSPSGAGMWKHGYIFPPVTGTITGITGCAQASDSLILFGYVQKFDTIISKFFVMKSDANGDTSWTRFYNTSSYDSASKAFSGYYCATSDILTADDGNFFACAYNVRYNTPSQGLFPVYTTDDNSARIFKFTAQGIILDSLRIKFGTQNLVADFVKKKDGGLFIGLNPNRLGNFNFVGVRNSFAANVSSNLILQNVSRIQSQYSDYLGSVCAMPDGHYAVETMIQSLGKENYHLAVIKSDENGNF